MPRTPTLPSRLRRAAATTLTLLGLLCCAAPALAARPHEFSRTLGEHCPGEPCTKAELLAPSAVAVNEATGEVYVLDKGKSPGAYGRVAVFSKAGAFVSEFDGSGMLAGEEREAGAGSEKPTGRFEKPEAIAVDNSCVLRKLSNAKLTQAQCEAEDPSNGDVYVADTGTEHKVVDKYTAAGKYLGQITEGEGPLQSEGLRGVAVDPKGTLWVYREGARVDQFTNAESNVFVAPQIQLLPGSDEALETRGFAVDSKDDFYGAVDEANNPGIPRVNKWAESGEPLIEELGGVKPTGVAVEQTSDASIIDTGKHLSVFSPDGSKELEQLGEEGGQEHLQAGAGVGVNAIEGYLYVADASAGPVVVFGPARPSAPQVEGESFKEVSSDEASVAAQINPRSEASEAASNYYFQYGRCATPSTCASSGYEVSLPAGQISPDFEVHEVSARLEGLAPETTYHFRVIAENAHGKGEGEDNFTTQGEGGPLTLPDGRGWELVSPPDKQGAQIIPLAQFGVVQAAVGGSAITYLTNAPTEASPQGYANQVQVLSQRSAGAWSSQDIAVAHSSSTGKPLGQGPEYKFFDPELTLSAVQPFGEFIPGLSAEASESTAYLHDLSEGCGASCFQPLVTGKAGFSNVPPGTAFGEEERCKQTVPGKTLINCGPQFLGATEDLSHVVLKANDAALTPGSSLGGLYEWSAGKLAPVSVLPGQQVAAREAGLGLNGESAASVATRGAISADGNRIAWSKNKEALYLRDMALGETVQLDAKQAGCEACESGGGKFQFASADGSRVFFTDTHRLTTDSGGESLTAVGKRDLYECQIVQLAGKLSCKLTDLTPARGAEAAEVQGSVLGASEDGTSVYFVAKGVLSEAANARGEKAEAGKPNLYVDSNGVSEFIATLAKEDNHDWNEVPASQPTRVSSDGRYLALMSQASLSGYDNRNRDPADEQPVAEVYLYDAQSKRMACASCEPSGERPLGVEYKTTEPRNGGLVGGYEIWPGKALVAANVPGWTGMTGGEPDSRHQPRYLANSGRLFFDSVGALVPQDSNGTQDVYEYEPPGVGDCGESLATYSARSGGCVSLISSGRSAEESAFLDASESGDDVFFLTAAKLSPLDTDSALDVYDAHLCSSAAPCISFSSGESPPCTTEASCKASPSPQPSIFGSPASSTFQGLGNPAPAAKKVVKKSLTRAQKLVRALKACRRDRSRSRRAGCERVARQRFGPLRGARGKKRGR